MLLPAMALLGLLGTAASAIAQESAATPVAPDAPDAQSVAEAPGATPEADVPVPGPPPPSTADEGPPSKVHQLIAAAQDYFTAPLHWTARDWAWFAGAVAATAGSHGYDGQVRTHFVDSYAPGTTISSHDVEDALPGAALLLGTMGWAAFTNDADGKTEAWTMQEAAILSTATVYPLKYIVRRQGPDQTSNANEWFKSGGSTFPSEHTAAAFAIGTVLAESGNDDYRWVRRVLGYGAGIGTAFLRLKHNAHWLSDTVAGSAIGMTSARFSMNRNEGENDTGTLALMPVDRGVMLTYRLVLN